MSYLPTVSSLLPAAPSSAANTAQGTNIAPRVEAAVDAGNLARPSAPLDPTATLRAAAEQIETYLKSMGCEVAFHVDTDSGKTVVTVTDTTSGEVIRQIPNEEVLRLAQYLDQRNNALVNTAV